jgi:hypothetical protein
VGSEDRATFDFFLGTYVKDKLYALKLASAEFKRRNFGSNSYCCVER